jgi:hypothetical protein
MKEGNKMKAISHTKILQMKDQTKMKLFSHLYTTQVNKSLINNFW